MMNKLLKIAIFELRWMPSQFPADAMTQTVSPNGGQNYQAVITENFYDKIVIGVTKLTSTGMIFFLRWSPETRRISAARTKNCVRLCNMYNH
jgi:hypothetical protein